MIETGYADLQCLVDDLANDLNAPTVIEDDAQRMVVYSTHGEPIDEVRRDSILHRRVPPCAAAWINRYGIVRATAPVRVPGDRGTGMLGRVCVPVRYRSRLMGFMWLIDDAWRLDDRDIAAAVGAAERAGRLLYEDELAHRLASGALADLLSPSEELRELAARQITDDALFGSHAPCVVVVVTPIGVVSADPGPTISEALWDVARRSPSTEQLRLSHRYHGVLLVRARSLTDDGKAMELARETRAALLARLADSEPAARVVAALGDPQAKLVDAVISYRQARLTAKVAAVVGTVGDLPRWRDLGVFRTLAQLPSDRAAESGLDPRVKTLLRSGDEPVVLTLETYLDLGCDAKATAERLHLHRGTLYYRLRKACEVSGIDLRDGNDRLSVHLGFKLARFTGLRATPLPPA